MAKKRPDVELAVSCPFCGASAGMQCTTLKGMRYKVSLPHTARFHAWRKVQDEAAADVDVSMGGNPIRAHE